MGSTLGVKICASGYIGKYGIAKVVYLLHNNQYTMIASPKTWGGKSEHAHQNVVEQGSG